MWKANSESAQDVFFSSVSSIQDLNCLFEIYLKPLQKETFLSQDEVKLNTYWSWIQGLSVG